MVLRSFFISAQPRGVLRHAFVSVVQFFLALPLRIQAIFVAVVGCGDGGDGDGGVGRCGGGSVGGDRS